MKELNVKQFIIEVPMTCENILDDENIDLLEKLLSEALSREYRKIINEVYGTVPLLDDIKKPPNKGIL